MENNTTTGCGPDDLVPPLTEEPPRRFLIREYDRDEDDELVVTSVRLWGVELPAGGALGFTPCRSGIVKSASAALMFRRYERVAEVDLIWVDDPTSTAPAPTGLVPTDPASVNPASTNPASAAPAPIGPAPTDSTSTGMTYVDGPTSVGGPTS